MSGMVASGCVAQAHRKRGWARHSRPRGKCGHSAPQHQGVAANAGAAAIPAVAAGASATPPGCTACDAWNVKVQVGPAHGAAAAGGAGPDTTAVITSCRNQRQPTTLNASNSPAGIEDNKKLTRWREALAAGMAGERRSHRLGCVDAPMAAMSYVWPSMFCPHVRAQWRFVPVQLSHPLSFPTTPNTEQQSLTQQHSMWLANMVVGCVQPCRMVQHL